MTSKRRIGSIAAGIAIGFIAPLVIATGGAAQPAPATLTIGIDNTPPAGHNWEFLDYFPNGGVNVHNGDTLHFKFNTASLDGFHTATLGKLGESLQSVVSNNPTLVPDADTGDVAGQQQFTPAFNPTNPPAGSGAPGACGDATTPCTYDGTSYQSSGALFSGSPFGTEFYFKLQLGTTPNQPTLVNYFCRVHGPAMSASFTIVPDATTSSTQTDLDTAATSQYNASLTAGQTATAAVAAAATTTNSDGTHTINMHAGTESPDGRVQVLEMLPNSVSITAGDKVNWTALSRNDPHTIVFPSPPGSGFDPFPTVCEGASLDTPDPTGNPSVCGGPQNQEIHYSPQAIGPTAIASATTQASSGVLDSGPPYSVGVTNFTFTFPNAGTFKYQCTIHDHMTGQVLAAAVPALPKAGAAAGEPLTVPTPGSAGTGSVTLVLTALLALMAGRVVSLLVRRRD